MASPLDTHAHIISTDAARYPRAPIGGRASDWSQSRPVDVAAMIAAMDAAGVARTALVQASTCYGHDNSYVADAVAAHPDRFTGVCSLDVLAPDAAAALRQWLARGFTGLRIFTTGSTMAGQQLDVLDDPRSFPVWEAADTAGIPVCLQMTAKALPQVEMLAQRFPRVRILLDHFARPDLEDGPPYARAAGLWALTRHRNIFLKASPHTFAAAKSGKATPASFFRRTVEEFGAARICWGSNFPAAEGTLAALLALARENFASLPASDQEWIFTKTALALYPALGAAK
ncbi:MAG TPA: amidohydrolase family protein [Stellaceae bacterium]|jgi:predicted TIM-barrel fold metal-dependent hydrolase